MTFLSPGARLRVIGAGGFARQVLAIVDNLPDGFNFGDIAFASDKAERGDAIGVYPIVDLAEVREGDRFVIAISNGVTRRALAEQAERAGAVAHSLVAASAKISPHASLGPGAMVCDFAVIEPFARVGRHFQANVRAFVAHDCVVGDYVTLGPNAHCNGNVHIFDDAYIGASAVIRQGSPDKPLRIGAGAIVGMGAVVTKDVPDGAVVVGNPARPLEC